MGNTYHLTTQQAQTEAPYAHDLSLLHEANQIFVSARQVQPVLTFLAREIAEDLQVEGCIIWIRDTGSPKELICQATYHIWLGQFEAECRLEPGEGVVGKVFKTGETAVLSDITVDMHTTPDISLFGSGTIRSLLAIPIICNDETVGVFEFINKTGGSFDNLTEEKAKSLVTASTIPITNALMAESLQQQIKDLEVRNEDLDAFAHSVAHDLQNPLSQVVGFTELLKFKLEALSSEEREYVVNALGTSANKMSAIIQELLLLASVRKAEVAVEPLNMENIVSHAHQRLTHMVKAHKAEIVLPETWPTVYGYAPWVEEVWENYLSNGIKYGGSPPKIELGYTERPYGKIQFWVRDNGEGFAPEVEKKLFAPFTDVRREANGGEKSYGLGLSIVRRIIERLEGTVAAECIQGQGSVFSFTLPGIVETGD